MAVDVFSKIERVEKFRSFRPPIPYDITNGEGPYYDPTVRAPIFKEVQKDGKSENSDPMAR